MKRWGLVLLSAALYQFAFPSINFVYLVFVCLVPWMEFLRGATRKQAAWSGAVFGVIFWLSQLYCLVPFVGRWTGSWGLAIVPWLLVPLLVGWFFVLAAVLMHQAIQRQMFWALPAVWMAVEVLRFTFPALMFPWGGLAFPLYQFPAAIQGAAFGDMPLVSAWVMLVNVLIWQMLVSGPRAFIVRAFVVAGVFLAISVMRYSQPPLTEKVPIMIGQTGVDMAFGNPDETDAKNLRAMLQFEQQAAAAGCKMLVLSEDFEGRSTIPNPPPVPTLYGRLDTEGSRTYRAAEVLQPAKNQVTRKSRLVIFGEYVPFRDKIPFLDKFKMPSGDISAAPAPQTLDVGTIKVAPMICFEGLFSDVARTQSRQGARLQAVMSIDDWYQGTGAMEQLMGNAVWRSVENGLPTVRAATLGYSMACDARGNILKVLPYGEQVGARVEVPVPYGPDGWEHRGLVGWAAALGVLVPWFKRDRKNSPKDAPSSP